MGGVGDETVGEKCVSVRTGGGSAICRSSSAMLGLHTSLVVDSDCVTPSLEAEVMIGSISCSGNFS